MASQEKEIKIPKIPKPPNITSYYGGEKETEEMERILQKEKQNIKSSADRTESGDAES